MGLDGAKVGGGRLKRMRRQAEIDLKMIIDEVKNIYYHLGGDDTILSGSVEDRSADTVSLMSSSTSMLKL